MMTTCQLCAEHAAEMPQRNQSSLPFGLTAWRKWIVAMAKRAYPIAFVLAILTAALAATIALRLAIWLPLHYL